MRQEEQEELKRKNSLNEIEEVFYSTPTNTPLIIIIIFRSYVDGLLLFFIGRRGENADEGVS